MVALQLPPARTLRVRTPDGPSIAAQDWSRSDEPAAELLLLHGYSQAHPCWLRQIESPLTRQFRLVTYDLRGHGSSEKPADARYYREAWRWAAELRAVIEQLRLRRPVVLAWSYAGRILLDYLAVHGDSKLAGAVFVAATTRTDAELFGPAEASLRAMTDPDPQCAGEASVAMLRASCARALSPQELKFFLEFNSRCPPCIRGWLRGRPAQYDEVLERLDLPVLIIHGDADQVTRPRMSQYTGSRVRGAECLIYPNVGHMPFWEAPERFNADVSRFIQKLG